MDTSARAASHELHAQRGPLAVTLYGKTTETGSAETEVTYPHDTKHYIDQKFDALAAALLS